LGCGQIQEATCPSGKLLVNLRDYAEGESRLCGVPTFPCLTFCFARPNFQKSESLIATRVPLSDFLEKCPNTAKKTKILVPFDKIEMKRLSLFFQHDKNRHLEFFEFSASPAENSQLT